MPERWWIAILCVAVPLLAAFAVFAGYWMGWAFNRLEDWLDNDA